MLRHVVLLEQAVAELLNVFGQGVAQFANQLQAGHIGMPCGLHLSAHALAPVSNNTVRSSGTTDSSG